MPPAGSRSAPPCSLPAVRAVATNGKSWSADSHQLAHSLDTQAALHRHHLPDLVVDTVSPEPPPLRRRAPTFCKAPLKKSTSRVFSASRRFKSLTCLRSSRIGDVAVESVPCSPASRCQ